MRMQYAHGQSSQHRDDASGDVMTLKFLKLHI